MSNFKMKGNKYVVLEKIDPKDDLVTEVSDHPKVILYITEDEYNRIKEIIGNSNPNVRCFGEYSCAEGKFNRWGITFSSVPFHEIFPDD